MGQRFCVLVRQKLPLRPWPPPPEKLDPPPPELWSLSRSILRRVVVVWV